MPPPHPAAVQAAMDHLADELREAHMKLAEARGNLAYYAAKVKLQAEEIERLQAPLGE